MADRLFKKLKRYEIWFLILLPILAAFPRAAELISGNYLFGYDQGEHYQAVWNIVVNHDFTLIGTEVGGVGGFFQGPGWYYLLSIPFFLTGGDPYGGMVLMFVIGIATVLFAYVLVRKMFGAPTAAIIAFVISLSPSIIEQSRFIWPPFPISFLSVFLLFAIFKVLNGDKRYSLAIAFTIGVMAHFEIATAGTLLAQVLLLTPFLFINKLLSVRYFLLGIGAFAFTQFTLILFDFRNDFLITRGVIRLFSRGVEGDATNSYLALITENHLGVFLSNFFGTFFYADLLWPGLVAIFLVGGYLYVKDNDIDVPSKLFLLYLVVSPFLLFVIFMLFPRSMWEWWILELPIYYCFLFGLLASYLWKRNLAFKLFLGCVIAIFAMGYTERTVEIYRDDFYDYGGIHKIQGKIDAIDYIYQDADNNHFGLLIFTPPVYTHAYDFLLNWYGKRTYGFVPSAEKESEFYLLIEPDPQKPWSYNGWLETVVKEGTDVSTVTLPSGFVVKKRTLDQ